jgi:hypothetical protein
MYPNYVYRPQCVKGKKAVANGKGKTRGAEEPETDSEGLSFVMPMPAVAQRMGRRAISVPTPPPAYQQTIDIPMVYMPSTPASPSMVPVTIPRTCSPTQIPTQLSIMPSAGEDQRAMKTSRSFLSWQVCSLSTSRFCSKRDPRQQLRLQGLRSGRLLRLTAFLAVGITVPALVWFISMSLSL